MEASSDPYEQKLYQMFQSCENSGKNSGFLDEVSLTRLCQLLQLRDQGAALISNLMASNSSSFGISFEQFKVALLNFLGSEFDSTTQSGFSKASGFKERSLVISAEPCQSHTNVPKEAEISDREVSPKIVVGTKKYGRRSRPHNIVDGSDSDISDDDRQKKCNNFNDSPTHVQRSASQSDLPGSRLLRTVYFTGSKLKRCASLPARRNIQSKASTDSPRMTESLIVATKTESSNNQNKLWNSQKEWGAMKTLEIESPHLLEAISARSIVETWEMAGINNSIGLLQALGFEEEKVNPNHLTKVLEEELRGMDYDPNSNVLRALVALQSFELGTLRKAYHQQCEEAQKLRFDNKTANQRVAILAAEVDERHAVLEDNCKQEVQALEKRHGSVIRELTQRISNDRERWASINTNQAIKIKCLEEQELKLKDELQLLRKENSEFEIERQNIQLKMSELLDKNVKLNKDLVACEHIQSKVKLESYEHELVQQHTSSEDNDIIQLTEKITALKRENTQLRDKVDELTEEIENLHIELERSRSKKIQLMTASPAESFEGEDLEGISVGLAIKRRGDSPSKTHMPEESPRIGKQRKCSEASEICENSGDWLPLDSEIQNCKKHEAEIAKLRQTVERLEKSLDELGAKTTTGGTSKCDLIIDARCKELENSLEQMQRAYEDCEDYWQAKLSEERQMFENERKIYEDDQLESDRKFTELMEKVREYEEQFNRDDRLSTIDERDVLEQQYVELEAEANNLRVNSDRLLEEKSQQIKSLQCEIEDLRTRLGESVEIITGACEINPDTLDQKSQLASSPISYLWHQSTIQEPVKTFHSDTDDKNAEMLALLSVSSSRNATCRDRLAPICKPKLATSESDFPDSDASSTASNKSFDSRRLKSIIKTSESQENFICPIIVKEELKRLKFFELSLKEQIKDLSLKRDGLVMELHQLQAARPVLEKAYARTTHPTLQQRLNQLELRNRHLLNAVKQQQKYTESLMKQSWRQHNLDLRELHSRIESQAVLIIDQSQRLQNADVLVKDLYVENSNMTGTIQRLENELTRVNLTHQQQHNAKILISLGNPGIP